MSEDALPSNIKLGFIGAGNMAQALIGGLLARGVAPDSIQVSDPSTACQAAAAKLGVQVAKSNEALVNSVDVVLLAIKPQVMHDVLTPLAEIIASHRPLLISIAAGITSSQIASWTTNDTAIVRCMPNTPALVGQGATALFANAAVDAGQRELATAILAAAGLALWVESESALDAVTALSGSGPAYFFLLIELMQRAGEGLGLDTETARQLTEQTALGAATMARDADVDVAELRRRVTSPNGTTHAAVQHFLDNGFAELVEGALGAAHRRSIELSAELGD